MRNTSNIGETEEQVERDEAMCGKRTSKFDDENEEVVEEDYDNGVCTLVKSPHPNISGGI